MMKIPWYGHTASVTPLPCYHTHTVLYVEVFAVFKAFTLYSMSCCDVFAEEESGRGGLDRN